MKRSKAEVLLKKLRYDEHVRHIESKYPERGHKDHACPPFTRAMCSYRLLPQERELLDD